MFANVCSNVLKISTSQIHALNSSRSLHKSHYEVLGVSKTCSTKDIKDAFITLSKVYHPDKSKTKDTKQQFVKVSEAYQILSKPGSRRLYDMELHRNEYSPNAQDMYRYTRRKTRPYAYGYDDPSFWANRRRHEHEEEHPYYGVPGVQRMPNAVIAIMCIFFSAIGALLQFYAIRHSVTMQREVMHTRSLENEKILAELKAEVAKTDKESQIKLMEEKFRKMDLGN